MTARVKDSPQRRVAEAWRSEQADTGAGRLRLGWEAMALPGWRWVPGMSVVPSGSARHRAVFLGTAPDGSLLSACHDDGTKHIHRFYSQGVAVDVLDLTTGYILLSLLPPHVQGFILPAPRSDGSEWEVRCIPMWEPLDGRLPLGVAVLAAAAGRGGWGAR